MKMRLIVIAASMFFVLANTQIAQAASCGFPPANNISIPNGETATREEIQQVVLQLQSFSSEMDNYLTCLDTNRESMLMNMNKEQQARWNEDYNTNVEALANLQNSLNEQIRIFNSRD